MTQYLDELKAALRELPEVRIQYQKKDGTQRPVLATLNQSVVPPYEAKGTKVANPNCIVVWDLEKAAWRSLSCDGIQSYELNGRTSYYVED